VFSGIPSALCFLEPPVQPPSGNPCVPSPCGPNSQCRAVGNTPACSCLPHYVGRAPNCRPECTINAECPSNLACQNTRCGDPCPGSCGVQATCVVVKHALYAHVNRDLQAILSLDALPYHVRIIYLGYNGNTVI
jgi:hypothetical protein